MALFIPCSSHWRCLSMAIFGMKGVPRECNKKKNMNYSIITLPWVFIFIAEFPRSLLFLTVLTGEPSAWTRIPFTHVSLFCLLHCVWVVLHTQSFHWCNYWKFQHAKEEDKFLTNCVQSLQYFRWQAIVLTHVLNAVVVLKFSLHVALIVWIYH